MNAWQIWDWANWVTAHYPRGVTARVVNAIAVRANRETLQTGLSQKYIASVVYAIAIEDVTKSQTNKVSAAVNLLAADGILTVQRNAFYLAKHGVWINKYCLQIDSPENGESAAESMRPESVNQAPGSGERGARGGGHNSQVLYSQSDSQTWHAPSQEDKPREQGVSEIEGIEGIPQTKQAREEDSQRIKTLQQERAALETADLSDEEYCSEYDRLGVAIKTLKDSVPLR